MKNNERETSEGLNQIIEIINAKGDAGEINEILKSGSSDSIAENSSPNS